MSWDLQVGEIKGRYVSENDIWAALNNFYFHSHVTMSYKFGFLKSLLENLYNVNDNLEINYNKLFFSFSKIYWNLVVHHKLSQSNNKKQISSIQRILEEIYKKKDIPEDQIFDKLPDMIQLEIVKEIKKAGKRYVIGAFYSDTKGFFYEFDLKQEKLRFNVPVYKFFKNIIE